MGRRRPRPSWRRRTLTANFLQAMSGSVINRVLTKMGEWLGPARRDKPFENDHKVGKSARSVPPAGVEWYTLQPQRLDNAEIEFTSRCNLRCTYCAVSRPDYVGLDLPIEIHDSILQQLRSIGVSMMQINGHGETTYLENWTLAAAPFLASFPCKIISNFARTFSNKEIEFLAQLEWIYISIDAADDALLRRIRRKVSTETIIENIQSIRRFVEQRNRKPPNFAFISGIYDKNVFYLPELARLGASLNIKLFHFWGLWKHTHVEGAINANSLDELPLEDQGRSLDCIDTTFSFLDNVGISYYVSGDFIDVFRNKLESRSKIPSDMAS
jgi:hypothetical protein